MRSRFGITLLFAVSVLMWAAGGENASVFFGGAATLFIVETLHEHWR